MYGMTCHTLLCKDISQNDMAFYRRKSREPSSEVGLAERNPDIG